MARILASTWIRSPSRTGGSTAARRASASQWGARPRGPLSPTLLVQWLAHVSECSTTAALTSAENAAGAGGPVASGGPVRDPADIQRFDNQAIALRI